ncbi:MULTISPECIES: iron-containing alcohol dehydrogenase family protein [unclassified Chelatococcus]|uniref:iron-containing alcohol dehydrogenase family protein n=1 Tax=unclassified Chelatococcus TaxID=2638111 RepID=UPI001BD11C71|nr:MULTISPECIES: iron-containing alcohol dehydrogenase family protein [unclassified Chelatococcus]CAH1648269.1 Alcohol dehydrogenase class IV [Hyphomicrobiales bacterium]MBS7742015.1 iron-containing alcohol dehydrogenase [Chelatococcus sp. HY11]MBX3541187.1 iron-containing alcohol dehydrogenase [Chelatococcus sp.]MCO5074920.1 iron-containing alcohol dehydrogenase family protein [Chelatococcus sp.]CAH1690646.1 Alcohol dehydrogenase class IV [Hyphomicrobiales bacterium]
MQAEAVQTSPSFRHFAPAMRLYYGEDSLESLRPELERSGVKRVVVFCGRSLSQHPQGLTHIARHLGTLHAGSFMEVASHSPLPAIIAGRDMLRETRADAVLALGGGSAIVTARGATILLGEDRPIEALVTRFAPGQPPRSPRLQASKLPQFIVPTTPTTAIAKAGTAVLEPGTGRRLTMLDPRTRAQAIFVDPRLALATPVAVVRDAALNAFAMAVQGLESHMRQPLADASLLEAVRLLRDNLPRLGTSADGADVRGALLLAAVLTGQGTDQTSCGLTSALGHCIGARHHTANGTVNAVLLPHVIRFNGPATGERLAAVAAMLGGDEAGQMETADAAARACASFFARLGSPSRLSDIGIEAAAFEPILADVEEDWFFHQNPRRVESPQQVRDILQAAL